VRVLVTGANGFVGRRLCAELNSAGFDVLRAVRRYDDLPKTVELSDLTSDHAMRDALISVDLVIHLAAVVHVMGDVNDSLEQVYQLINVDFSMRLAAAASHSGVKRFIFLSSVKVCGESSVSQPFSERDAANPSGPYSVSKWNAERELFSIAKSTGLELVILRAPLVYGPGVRANFFKLMAAVGSRMPLPLLMLSNKRSMIYIENLVSALIVCSEHPSAAGETFHVADEISTTLPELVNEISFAFGFRNRLFPLPIWILKAVAEVAGKNQQFQRLTNQLEIDSRKIRSQLDWSPAYSLRDGIKSTVEWYKSRRNIVESDNQQRSNVKIKVCQLCAVDFTLQHLLLPLVDGMRAQGWTVTAVCADGQYFQELRSRGYSLHEISITRSLFKFSSHIKAIWRIYKLCRSEKFDVLHVHTPIAAVLGRIAGRLAGVPIIVYTAHGFYFHEEMSWWKYRLFVLVERWCGRLHDYLFTQSSEDAQTAIVEGIAKADKLTAIGNGVNISFFTPPDAAYRAQVRASLGLPTDVFVIGVVARMVKEKGIIEFLQAAIKISTQYPQAHFVLVGDRLVSDHNASVEAELCSAQQKLGSHLHTLGYRSNVKEVLCAMDLFCLPSYREGLPRSIIEAMAVGLPVVATNIRGTREEVVHGETGLLVPTRDADALAKAFVDLIMDSDLSHRMGRMGRKRVVNLYNESRVIALQIEVINNLYTSK
jgi:nucleoside-diphosphate-sugar epimerase/glycosyltransferase involved in cell wall biosynthesis